MPILLSFLSLLSSLLIGMHKQFLRDHNIPAIQGVSRNNNACLLFYYIDKFINHYIAEEILCNCLEATSRLYNPDVTVMPVFPRVSVVFPTHISLGMRVFPHIDISLGMHVSHQ